MRTIITLTAILSASVAFYSCSPQYHIQRADKHTEKAISKGAILTNDTTYIYDTDTLTTIFTRNDTTFVTNTVTKTNYIESEIRYITKKDKRKERKRERREDRRNHKVRKIAVRQDAKTDRTQIRRNARNFWWLWLAIGIVLGFVILKIFSKLGVKI